MTDWIDKLVESLSPEEQQRNRDRCAAMSRNSEQVLIDPEKVEIEAQAQASGVSVSVCMRWQFPAERNQVKKQ